LGASVSGRWWRAPLRVGLTGGSRRAPGNALRSSRAGPAPVSNVGSKTPAVAAPASVLTRGRNGATSTPGRRPRPTLGGAVPAMAGQSLPAPAYTLRRERGWSWTPARAKTRRRLRGRGRLAAVAQAGLFDVVAEREALPTREAPRSRLVRCTVRIGARNCSCSCEPRPWSEMPGQPARSWLPGTGYGFGCVSSAMHSFRREGRACLAGSGQQFFPPNIECIGAGRTASSRGKFEAPGDVRGSHTAQVEMPGSAWAPAAEGAVGQRRVPMMARSWRRRASRASGVRLAYLGGRRRRLEDSKTARSSMYSSSSVSRLGK
jgi:hypothetical protein